MKSFINQAGKMVKVDYRIQTRRFSSNVIEKGVFDPEKEKWTWSVHLCPTCPKEEGDKVTERMLQILKEEDKSEEE